MNPVKTHKDLDLWKASMDFVVDLYKTTEMLPASEKFGLISQMRRAGVSIPSNIAEGAARQLPKEFRRFLFIALGSLAELETQLEIVFRLGFLSTIEKEIETLTRIRKMLINLIHAIQKKIQEGQ